MMRSLFFTFVGCLLGIGLHAAWGTQSSDAAQADVGSASVTAVRPRAEPAGRACDCRTPSDSQASAALPKSVTGSAGAAAPRPSGDDSEAEVAAAQRDAVAEAEAARVAQTRLLERALASGAWTDEDATAMRSLVPKLSNEDRPKALLSLAQAVNSGRLKMETPLPF